MSDPTLRPENTRKKNGVSVKEKGTKKTTGNIHAGNRRGVPSGGEYKTFKALKLREQDFSNK